MNQFVSAGYFLARRSNRQNRLLSASTCICDFFPDSWAIRWSSDNREKRERSAAAFGIGPGEIDPVLDWATASFEKTFGWPDTFYSLAAAQAARSDFLSRDLDVVVFGLGLRREDSDLFLRESAPQENQPGCAPVGTTGVYQCVKAQRTPVPDGRPAGFELLASMDGLLTCSWLCNGLETVCAENLGIRPNRYGFIDEYADARRCAEYVSRDEVGAEPGLWLPWLLTVYAE